MTALKLSEISVLLIEDEPSLSDLLEAFLQQIGVKEVSKAYNGQEALIKLRMGDVKPNLVLCDLKMPVMDGFEFLVAIRSDMGLEFKDLPVLVLSGSNEEKSIKKAAELDIQGYLVKPIEIDDLKKRILSTLAVT